MTVIVDILVEHFEEIEFLWSQRHQALRSADYQEVEIRDLEDRIDAHLQGLIVGGEHSAELAMELLPDDDRFVCFAGAWCLAHLGRADLLIDQLAKSNLDGVAEALSHSPIDSVLGRLKELYASEKSEIASAIGMVLSAHRLDPESSRLHEFLADEDPAVRRRGWETVIRSDAGEKGQS